ncbi:hypothetical protein [Microbulbifer sp. TYP-18]|uniref:hypothetical protein n=1 Tax=Microbulbifer sp. TYP-18 TaxID=3230024 RepID=UPI0034C5B54B
MQEHATSAIEIRDLLWEWSRAYPERAGDSVSWPRMAAFGLKVPSGREPIDYERAEQVDRAVLVYLNAVMRRKDRERAKLEEAIFWLRYYYRWERQKVAKRLKRSKAWVDNMCNLIEGTVEAFYLAQNVA